MVICPPQYGLSPNSDAGGEIYDEQILKGLANRGHKIEIILPYQKPYATGQHNWCVHRLPLPFIHYSYLFNLAIIPRLLSIYKKTGFRVLRVHSPYYVGLGAFLFKKIFAPRTKLVATYFHLEKRVGFNLIDSWLIRKWDGIITVSQFTKEAIVKKYGLDKSKITVIYPGTGDNFPINYREKTVKSEKENPQAVFCGLLIKRKNIGFLLKIAREIKDENFKLFIIGRGPERKKLERQAKKMGLEDKVTFTGYLNDQEKTKIIKSSDVFLFPSLMEGFGMAPLEAMSLGVPAIVSNRGALPEAAGKGATVLDLDVDLWAKEVVKIWKNPELKTKLSQKARKRSEEFGWRKSVDKTEEFIKFYDH